jgi:hypothetical protein
MELINRTQPMYFPAASDNFGRVYIYSIHFIHTSAYSALPSHTGMRTAGVRMVDHRHDIPTCHKESLSSILLGTLVFLSTWLTGGLEI